MTRYWLCPVLLAVLAYSAAAQSTVGLGAADEPNRALQGRVLGPGDNPLSEAVVYLKNTKSLTVKTFITEKDGAYHFNALSTSVDYDVYAEFQGRKSDVKTLSSFDGRKLAVINLRVK